MRLRCIVSFHITRVCIVCSSVCVFFSLFLSVKRKRISGTFRFTIRNLIRLSSGIAINTFIVFILLGVCGTTSTTLPYSSLFSVRFFSHFNSFHSISFFFVFSFDGSLYALCGESFASLIWLLSMVCNICSTDTYYLSQSSHPHAQHNFVRRFFVAVVWLRCDAATFTLSPIQCEATMVIAFHPSKVAFHLPISR